MEKPDSKLEDLGIQMGKYMDEYRKAEKAGTAELLTKEIYTWTEEGQEIAGVVKKVSEFTGGKFDTIVNQYEIDTGVGVVSLILGSATDKQLNGVQLLNKKIYIQYKGQKEITGGMHVNIFKIKVW